MNLINRVLHDLERRGAALPDPAGSIWAVSARADGPRRGGMIALAAAMIACIAGAAVAAWDAAVSPPAGRGRQAPPASAMREPLARMAAPLAGLKGAAASAVNGPPDIVSTPQPRVETASMAAPGHEEPAYAHEPEVPALGQVAPPHERKPGTAARAQAAPRLAAQERQPLKQVSPQQLADDEFNQAILLVQQGRKSEAQGRLDSALRLNPQHSQARQALVGLLLEDKRTDEAERVLRDWLHDQPGQVGVAMALARVQIERGAAAQAQETLEKVAAYAGERADYHAFVAAVLQRGNRHAEAVMHYEIALRQQPDTGVWLMGLGISLQALKRNEEAREAYKRAIASHGLSKELQDYVERRMKEL